MHQQINAAQLQQRMQSGEALHLLDVREPVEFHTFNIGGQNIPVGKLLENINSINYNKTDEIIVICSAGIRSETASAILTDAGYTGVVNFTGGLKALQKLNRQNNP